jgi:hypothetical protein
MGLCAGVWGTTAKRTLPAEDLLDHWSFAGQRATVLLKMDMHDLWRAYMCWWTCKKWRCYSQFFVLVSGSIDTLLILFLSLERDIR